MAGLVAGIPSRKTGGGNLAHVKGVIPPRKRPEENSMPVFILWAIPAVIILGGGAYWIVHMH
jgi:hypothetical protein